MAKRRSRQSHTGSVYQSGGYWWAAIMIAGKRKRVRSRSKAEALEKLVRLRKDAEESIGLDSTSFGGFSKRWLEHIAANKATNTLAVYTHSMAHFAALDAIPLDRINGQMIQQVIDGLSGRTRQQAFDKCRQMLKMAIKWRCLARNPMEHMDRPSHERETIDPFTIDEVNRILEYLQGHRYSAAVRLAFACGLRGGELWGLQWQDLKGSELHIQRQAAEAGGKLEVKQPKTSTGVRRLLLPDSVVEALEDRRRDALKEGNAKSPWIFCGDRAAPTRRSNFSYRVWAPTLKELGIRHRGFHHARHTAATMLLNTGAVPLAVVSKILGHATPAITLNTYSHVMTADLERHRNAFDLILKRA